MSDTAGGRPPSEVEAAQILVDDLQVDLASRVRRLRLLAEIEIREAAGQGLILPGGLPAQHAYLEARQAFVQGQFVAVVMLSQCLLENLLAGHVYMEDIGREVRSGVPQRKKKRPDYRDTLAACQANGLLSEDDESELRRLADRRNALAHFRDVTDPSNVERRSLSDRRPSIDILEEDAAAAIVVLSMILGKSAFRFSLE